MCTLENHSANAYVMPLTRTGIKLGVSSYTIVHGPTSLLLTVVLAYMESQNSDKEQRQAMRVTVGSINELDTH